MVVRELIAAFGIKTDANSVKTADNAMGGLTKKLSVFALQAVGITIGFKQVVEAIKLAAKSEGTIRKLGLIFEDQAASINTWAEAYAKSSGRSRYELKEMALDLGTILRPTLDDNAEAAARMSEGLTELSVDLGAFFGEADPEVMQALRLGVAGATRGLKRFGIVASDTAMKEFLLSKGIKKSMSDMSQAEQTTERYEFILAKTAKMQGYASKTSGSFGDSIKRLKSMVRDVSTDFGLALMPAVKGLLPLFKELLGFVFKIVLPMGRLVGVVGELALCFIKLVRNLPAAGKVAALGAAVLLLEQKFLLLTKALNILKAHPVVILLGLLLLIIEDLKVWMEGGVSVFGRFFEVLDEITGIPISEFIKDIIRWLGKLAVDPVAAFETMIGNLVVFFKEFVDGLQMEWAPFIKWLNWGISKIFTEDLPNVMNDFWEWVKGWAARILKTITSPFKSLSGVVSKQIPGSDSAQGTTGRSGPFLTNLSSGARPTATTASPGRSGPFLANLTNTVNIDMTSSPGMDSDTLSKQVADKVDAVIQKQNREALRALVPVAAR